MWETPWLAISVFLLAASVFMGSFGCAVYVCYRILLIALSLDASILRETAASRQALEVLKQSTQSGSQNATTQIREYLRQNAPATDGDFVGTSEEEFFELEQVRRMTELQKLSEELAAEMVKHGKGADS